LSVSVFLLFYCLEVCFFSCVSVLVCLFRYWFIIWLRVGPPNVTLDPVSQELKEDTPAARWLNVVRGKKVPREKVRYSRLGST